SCFDHPDGQAIDPRRLRRFLENLGLNVRTVGAAVGILLLAAGCRMHHQKQQIQGATDAAQALANSIQFTTADASPLSQQAEVPFTIYDEATEYWDLTPQEAIHTALQNATVLRNLGG